MLTSYHYLLGGFITVSCSIGVTLNSPNQAASRSLPQGLFGTSLSSTLDIAYRGSGRLDGDQNRQKVNQKYGGRDLLISHRGSGRNPLPPSVTRL